MHTWQTFEAGLQVALAAAAPALARGGGGQQIDLEQARQQVSLPGGTRWHCHPLAILAGHLLPSRKSEAVQGG